MTNLKLTPPSATGKQGGEGEKHSVRVSDVWRCLCGNHRKRRLRNVLWYLVLGKEVREQNMARMFSCSWFIFLPERALQVRLCVDHYVRRWSEGRGEVTKHSENLEKICLQTETSKRNRKKTKKEEQPTTIKTQWGEFTKSMIYPFWRWKSRFRRFFFIFIISKVQLVARKSLVQTGAICINERKGHAASER